MAPINAEAAMITIMILFGSINILMTYIGAIFCQVISRKHIGQDILFITSGNHI